MLSRPDDCIGCQLHDSGIAISFSRPEGTGANGVAVFAEALGEAESEDGLPLRPHAQAGGVFHRALTSLGMDRSEFVLWNTVACRPGPRNWLEGAPYEYGAIAHCRVHMDRVVTQFRPKVIVALGGISARTLTGWDGRKKTVSSIRGYLVDGFRYPEIPVLSTYHPSYIARGKSNVDGVLRHDLKTAVRLAKGWKRPEVKGIWAPSREVRAQFKQDLLDHPDWTVFYDIETEESAGGADEADLRALPGGIVQVTTRSDEFADDAPDIEAGEGMSAEQAVERAGKTIVEQKRTRITQIQFSFNHEWGLVMPFEGEFVQYAQEILALRNPKCGVNNSYFDDPLLFDAGMRFGSYPMDLMKLHNHLQKDIPRGLQYIVSFWWPELGPWKHLSDSDVVGYGVRDVCAPAKVLGPLIQLAKDRGVWDGFLRNVHELHRLRIRCSARGLPVDTEEQKRLDVEIEVQEKDTFARLQTIYPEELKRVEPTNGYANEKIAEKVMLKALGEGERWERRDFNVVVKPRKAKAPKPVKTKKPKKGGKAGSSDDSDLALLRSLETDAMDSSAPANGAEVGPGEVQGELSLPPEASGGPVPIMRWCRVQPFLPNSPKQILTLLRHWEIPPPRSFKEDKETTSKDELKKLAKKYPRVKPLVDRIVDYREYKKIRSTYINGWQATMEDPRGFEKPLDLTAEESRIWDLIGFVHPTFVPWPATGQTGARNPNSTNVPAPKGGDNDNKSRLAIAIRKTVRAKPRYKLVDLDWTSFHALTLGFNSKDSHYMWLSRRDIHSFIAGNMLKVDGYDKWPVMVEREDEELTAILKWWKNSERLFNGKPFGWHRNKRAKPSILGIGFGLGPNKLWMMNEDSFTSRKDAGAVIDMVFHHFPKVRKFQNDIREKAYDQKYLLSPHGYIRWFWDVYHWQMVKDSYEPRFNEKVVVGRNGRKYKQVWGEDSEASIAFLPANNAFGHKHDVLWSLEGEGLLERYGWCNDEHDGLKFHCREGLVGECVWEVGRHMQAKSKVLVNEAAPEGLWCAVEASVGNDWSSMSTVRMEQPKMVAV